MKSVKQQYINLKEGKMNQAQFMRNVRMTLPHLVTNTTSFDDTVKILRNKAILTEADIKEADIYGIAGDPEAEAERKAASMSINPKQTPEEKYDVGKKIDQSELNFLKKIYTKTPTEKIKKMIDDLEQRMSLNEYITSWMDKDPDIKKAYNEGQSHKGSIEENPYDKESNLEQHHAWAFGYISKQNKKNLKESYTADGKELYSKFSEIDNLNGQEVLIGVDYEMQNNTDLTKKEAVKIVIKKLKKNPFYYTDSLMAGKEGYEPEYIGGKSANVDARQMQLLDKNMSNVVDKKMGMQPVKGIEKIKASANKANKETNKPEAGIKLMSLVAKTVRGVKKMDATGEKMKKMTLKENQDIDIYSFKKMLDNHDWYYMMSDDSRVYDIGSEQEKKLKNIAKTLGPEGIEMYNTAEKKYFPNTNSLNEYLDEAKASSLSTGDKFKLASDLGKFVMNEEVEVVSVEPFGNDVKLVLSNGKDQDDFYLDRNDEI